MGVPSISGRAAAANCHAASADPTQPSTGPQLTLANLQAHAADAGKPLGEYVAESILVPGAYAVPGYVSGIMQPPRGLSSQQVEDLVSYLIGKPWTSSAGGPLKLPAKPIAACDAKASCRATVAALEEGRADCPFRHSPARRSSRSPAASPVTVMRAAV